MTFENRPGPRNLLAIAVLVIVLAGILFLSDRGSAASLTFTVAEDTFANSSSPSRTTVR
jgi:hypothetical protein